MQKLMWVGRENPLILLLDFFNFKARKLNNPDTIHFRLRKFRLKGEFGSEISYKLRNSVALLNNSTFWLWIESLFKPHLRHFLLANRFQGLSNKCHTYVAYIHNPTPSNNICNFLTFLRIFATLLMLFKFSFLYLIKSICRYMNWHFEWHSHNPQSRR